jgi:hypothetical protein
MPSTALSLQRLPRSGVPVRLTVDTTHGEAACGVSMRQIKDLEILEASETKFKQACYQTPSPYEHSGGPADHNIVMGQMGYTLSVHTQWVRSSMSHHQAASQDSRHRSCLASNQHSVRGNKHHRRLSVHKLHFVPSANLPEYGLDGVL